MSNIGLPTLSLLSALLLAGFVSPVIAQKKSPGAAPGDIGTFNSSGRYVLSETEQKLDCKKVNGRVNMRLLQLRAELAEKLNRRERPR